MEIYLNIAEWGPNGEFGVEAGGRHAFNRSARELGSREAALLAAILPNPKVRKPASPVRGSGASPGFTRRRRHGRAAAGGLHPAVAVPPG